MKGWRKGTLQTANRDRVELNTPRGPATEANPLRQARDYALELVNLMQADPLLVHGDGPFRGRLIFPYGWGAVLAGLRSTDLPSGPARHEFEEVFPSHQVLLRDDLDDTLDKGDFQRRLWGMFNVSYPHTLSLPQRDRIRWHLFPELRVSTQAALDLDGGPSQPQLPDLLQVMDVQQEQIARTLGEGHRVIHGAAGSGKTMILIHRAQHLAAAARPDQPVLVLCFNRTLADRISAQLRERGVDERVQVRTFHSWCKDVVDSYQLYVPPVPDRDAQMRQWVETVERSLETGFVPGGQYTALLVDEAHDFEDAWLRMAVRLVNPATNSLLVLYDDAQSIYQRKRRSFSFASVGIEARGRTSVLRMNYRNTAEVLALAVHCAQSLLAVEPGAADPADDGSIPLVQPASAGRRGALPVLIEAAHEHEEADLLAERIVQAQAAGLSLNDMALLCRTRAQMRPLEQALNRRRIAFQSMNAAAFRHFDWHRPSVKLLTLHSAKGLEFSQVFLVGLQALPWKGESLEDAVRLLYVGMTRATHTLVLSAVQPPGTPPSALVLRLRQALTQVGQAFSAAAGGG